MIKVDKNFNYEEFKPFKIRHTEDGEEPENKFMVDVTNVYDIVSTCDGEKEYIRAFGRELIGLERGHIIAMGTNPDNPLTRVYLFINGYEFSENVIHPLYVIRVFKFEEFWYEAYRDVHLGFKTAWAFFGYELYKASCIH